MVQSKQCKVSKNLKSRDKLAEIIADVINYSLAAILIGISGAWIFDKINGRHIQINTIFRQI